MEEIKQIRLNDEEVDEYNNLLKKFDKTVEKSVEEEIKQRKSSFFWASLVGGFFIGIFIGLMFTL